MSKALEFGQTLLVMLIVVGTAWWVGMIIQARGEHKLLETCAPVQYATDGLALIAGKIMGGTPRWALEGQGTLLSSCYYGASRLLGPTVGDSTAIDKK